MPVLLALLCLFCAACEFALDDAELYGRAQDAYSQGNFRAASVDLRNYVRRKPDDVEARLLLGNTLVQIGDAQGALSEAEKAAELGGSAERTSLLRGRAQYALGRFTDARASIESHEPPPGGDHAAWLTLRGDIERQLGNHTGAKELFQAALKESAANPTAWVGLALSTYQLEGFVSASEVLSRAKKAVPGSLQVDLALGQLQTLEHRYGDAERTFVGLLAHAEKNGSVGLKAQALAGLVESRLGVGKAQEAFADATRLGEVAPGSPLALYSKARASFVLAKYDEARQLLEQLLSQRPGDVPTQMLLGAVNYAQGNLGQADMYLSAVLAADPQNAFASRLLAESKVRERQSDGPGSSVSQVAPSQGGNVSQTLAQLTKEAASRPNDRATQLQLANAYLLDGQHAQALSVLQRLPQSADGPDEREYLLVFAKVRQGDLPGGVKQARDLIRTYPRSIEMRLMLAALQEWQGKPDDAKSTLDAALAMDARNPSVLLGLARLDIEAGRLESAEQHAQKALEARPRLMGAALTLARISVARADGAATLRWLEQAAEWEPQAPQPQVLLARYHLANGNSDKAYEHAQNAVRLAPADSTALDLLAQSAMRMGKADEALAQVEKQANQQRGSAMHRFALARANMIAGRLPEAEAAAREAVKLDPKYLPASLLLVSLLVRQEDTREAETLLERLKRENPSHPALLSLAGDLAMQRKNYTKAAESYAAAAQSSRDPGLIVREYQARRLAKDPSPTAPFDRWLERKPSDKDMRLLAAQARMEVGDNAAARRDYEALIASDPKHVVAMNNLAWLYHEARDSRALPMARQAYNLAPKQAAVADTYGWILIENGNFTEGLPVLRNAVSLAPANGEIRVHLVQGLARAGHTDEARRELSDLIDRDPMIERRADVAELRKSLRDPA